MMKLYRVQTVTPAGEVVKESAVRAGTPEGAVSMLIPGKLSRGCRGQRATLRAKVYAPDRLGIPTLIRFYDHGEAQQ